MKQNENLPTPAEAERRLHVVMCSLSRVFAAALERGRRWMENKGIEPLPDFTTDPAQSTLEGYCGIAQSFIDAVARGRGLGIPRPFALQTLPRPFPHVALTLRMETAQGPKTYLCDPTYRQFCAGGDTSPSEAMQDLPEGEHLHMKLLEDGFFEMTPARGVTYLSAFSGGGNPFRSDRLAAAFFENPPPSPYNRWFPEQELEKRGFLGPEVEAVLARLSPSAALPRLLPRR